MSIVCSRQRRQPSVTIRITNTMFATHGIAVHCPGPLHERWHHFFKSVLGQPKRRLKCPDGTILTCNSGIRAARPNKPCGVLERSLDLMGIRATVLGQGKTNWQNRDKFKLFADALDNVNTSYVIGADSCDVAFLDNPRIAVDRFESEFTCDLLFNATGSRCWPELPGLVHYQSALPLANAARGRHWINSGLFIGKTEFCRHYFRELADSPPVAGFEASDQAVVMQTWRDWYPSVQADYFSQIFQWFNEASSVMRWERPLAQRQRQLTTWLRRLPSPITAAEVGVFYGHTSEALLREFPQLRLWMIDPWRPYDAQSSLGSQSASAFETAMASAMCWTEFARDRRFVLREPSPKCAARFCDGELDFVFIDGNHCYEAVCADIFAWWPKVRSGGLLTGHDYDSPKDKTETWGVRRAVDEFADATNSELRLGLDGTWCIERQ